MGWNRHTYYEVGLGQYVGRGPIGLSRGVVDMCLADKIALVMRRREGEGKETVMVTDEEGETQGVRRLLYLFYNLQVMGMGKMYATILCAQV